MARLRKAPSPSPSQASSTYHDSRPRTEKSRPALDTIQQSFVGSPSPAPSSDKENRNGLRSPSHRSKMDSWASMEDADAQRHSKRRRLGEHNIPLASQVADENIPADELVDLEFYDPLQDPALRRQIRLDLRQNLRHLADRRDELQQPDNNKLCDIIQRNNETFKEVRQTSDATIDSRFLVQAGDIAYKKTLNLTLGDSASTIDVDEFVSKCITYMRNGGPLRPDEEAPRATQSRRRRHRAGPDSDDGEDVEDGDALDWAVFGEQACFANNKRPPVATFLLGPLSVQKRVRASQRRPRLAKERSQAAVTRPQELDARDLEQAENANLTTLCRKIQEGLKSHLTRSSDAVDNEIGGADWDEDSVDEVMRKHRIAINANDEGCVSLFEFALNPFSFGQTVENLFYISFLIRDGNVKIEYDKDGLPLIVPAESLTLSEKRAQNVIRNQAVFSLDFPTWQKLVKAYQIREPLIPHRDDAQGVQVSAGSWYG